MTVLAGCPAFVALALLAACTTPAAPPADPPQELCASRTGLHDGFYFSFWKDGGDACITLGPRGKYSTRYDLAGRRNMVTGKGWGTGSASRTVGYRADRFDAGSNSYLTLYGWSVDPLVEYYVVDNWGSDFTPPGHGAPLLGTLVSDGGTYNIYRTTRVEQPSIRGRATFDQYWSVRTERRPVGTDARITFANHVQAWERLGMKLGTMNYQVMATEGFGSSGGSEVTVREE